MAVDLNQAEEQGGGFEAIPEDSVVMVVANIRPPASGREGTVHPMFCKATSGYEYLDFQFEVITPKFKGRKIWSNFMLAYTKAENEKSKMAISIAMKTLRAIVEAGRGVSPKDSSPDATAKRILNDFSDINGMMVPVVVGVEWGIPNATGKRYLNNTIKRVVTPDDPRSEKMWKSDQEMLILSDKPLPPEPPKSGYEESAGTGGKAPAWAAGKQEPAKAAPTTGGKPAWMK